MGSCCSCDPGRWAALNPTSYTSLKSLHSVALVLYLCITFTEWICCYCFNMEGKCRIHGMYCFLCQHGFNAHQVVYSLLQFGCSYVYISYVSVSCWKPRLPCPCDPYGHCQRPCQGSAPYQLARSLLRLSLPARGGEERRKEKGGERCLFVCLLCFI